MEITSTYATIRMISSVVWLIVGIVMGNKAKEVGLSFWASFLITWLLGLIGLAISVSMINRKKKENAMQNMFMNQYQNPYQNPYQSADPYQNQYQNPYQNSYQDQNQAYQNQTSGDYRRYNQNDYQTGSNASARNNLKSCPNCGNMQRNGGFCEICGTKLD